jgi:hypothetical protein
MFGRPAVHHGASVHFIDGLATEPGVGVIKKVEHVKALVGRQDHRRVPRIAHV